MLDLKIIRSESEKIAENCLNRNVEVDIPELLSLDREVRQLNTELDSLRQERNEISNNIKQQLSQEERRPLIERSKALREEENNKEEYPH